MIHHIPTLKQPLALSGFASLFSFFQNLLLIILTLLVFAGQASAGPNANAVVSVDIDASDNKMNDGNTAAMPLSFNSGRSAQNSFSLSLDVDGSAGDQSVTSANVSTDEMVAIQIFGQDIRNANGLSVRFEYDAGQVTYDGFAAGDVLPNAQALPSQGTGFVEIGIASLGGQATANSGLVGTVRFRTTGGFSGTVIRLVRAELGRSGQLQSMTLDVRVELKLQLQVLTPDFNRDGKVDFSDFLVFAGQYGARQSDGRYETKYDLDSDGAIGFGDFLIFSISYGKDVSTPPGGGGGGGSATAVDIPDANLRAVIADSLGKARGAAITRAEMATLTRLAAPNSNISDLTGLEHATGLTRLVLGAVSVSGGLVNSNEISDLSPLSGLTNLRTLSLSFNRLSDVSALSNLTNLTWLNLGANDLTGGIPSWLGNLTNLEVLHLFNNALSGRIPTELGNLTNLEVLGLHGNQLSGSIPSELGSLTNLTELSLNGNELSGGIPSELGSLTNLTRLWLRNNALSGGIPSELGSLTNLTGLALNGNDLSGSIPVELGNLTNLEVLWLRNNALSGGIPSELGSLSNLIGLALDRNQLSGSIPAELGNLTNLTELYLFANASLSGPLPGSFTGLDALELLHMDGTGLCAPTDAAFQTWLQGIANKRGVVNCGDVPASDRDALVALYNATDGPNWRFKTNWLSDRPLNEWYGVTADASGRVTQLRLYAIATGDGDTVGVDTRASGGYYFIGNGLSGSIPSELGSLANLTELWLQGNDLTGGIPSELGNLTNLEVLWLRNNPLSGRIPAELGSLTNLTRLDLSFNELTGRIPAELGNLTNLQWLVLYQNELSGGIPTELGSLTNLTVLDLSFNELSGGIPSELGNLTNLTALSLGANDLTGGIPSWLGSLTNLTRLALYANELSGSIPVELGNLTNLQELWLGANDLTGGIPSWLGNLTNLQELYLNGNAGLSGPLPGSFTGLNNLTTLSMQNTGLCAPMDAAFQTWLQGIASKSGVVNCGSPDLIVESPSVNDNTLTTGQSFTLSATVRNQGSRQSAATTLRYYRSSDATISTTDTEVGTDAVDDLAASRTSAESISLTAPSSAGTYYYGACVESVSGESDTDNNCSDGIRVTVETGPDLVVESPSVSNSSLTVGQSFTLSATVRNQGGSASASTTLRYYRSSDATISTGDTEVGTDAVDGLAASMTNDESISLTAPSSAGTYYYGACVASVSGESNTNNNCSPAVQVTVSSGSGTPKIYWTDWNAGKIQRSNLDGSGVEDLVSGLIWPSGIALDVGSGKIYWSNLLDPGPSKIQRSNLDGSGVEDLVTGLNWPSSIALDVGSGKIYWTDTGPSKIQRSNLDGSGVEDLVTGLNWPGNIALDVGAKKMYWSDSEAGKVQRSNLDGTNVEDLVTGLRGPFGIALDVNSDKMYWTNSDKIQRSNLDGTNVEDLVTTGLRDPVGIALDVGTKKMYWSDSEAGKVQRSNLDGTNVEDLVTGLRGPFGIALDTSGRSGSGGSPDPIVESPSVNVTP